MKWIVFAAALATPSLCLAQTQPMDVTVVPGACQAQSSLAGKAYDCDNAIFAFFDNQNRHVMIQFAKKSDDSAPFLGFGGTMEDDGVTLDVDRIYLEAGKPQAAEKSSCKLTFKEPQITGIACSGHVQGGGVIQVDFKPTPGL